MFLNLHGLVFINQNTKRTVMIDNAKKLGSRAVCLV